MTERKQTTKDTAGTKVEKNGLGHAPHCVINSLYAADA